jgi:phosphatidylglycerophosphate synthase
MMLEYANKNALNNPIQFVLYAIAFPIALIFKKLHVSPNQLTLLSVLLTVLAVFFLIEKDQFLFLLYWSTAYILDYTDGTLARMTKKIRRTALRIDHVCDQLKIILIFLGFGIYYSNYIVWVLCFLASTLFLFYSLVNHDLSSTKKLLIIHSFKSSECVIDKIGLKEKIKRKILNNYLFSCLYKTFFNTLFTINGHTLLIFFIIPINLLYCKYFLYYFIIICLLNILLRLLALSRIKNF